jgi:Uncharacterised protein family (UPF0236)
MRKLRNKLNTQEAAMDFITYVGERLKEELSGIIESYRGQVSASSLSEMEVTVRKMAHELGNEVMKGWLETQDEKYSTRERRCECGGQAGYVRRRKGMVITLQGRVYYRRAYYLCRECQRGHYPLDRRLGVEAGKMSEEVVKQAALVGIQDAFGAAQQTLAELTLLELSPTSIHKASQMMGERVIAAEEQVKKRSQNLDSQLEQRRREAKPARLYGSLDGFMVPLEDGWHEMKGGLWWTTVRYRLWEGWIIQGLDGMVGEAKIHRFPAQTLPPTQRPCPLSLTLNMSSSQYWYAFWSGWCGNITIDDCGNCGRRSKLGVHDTGGQNRRMTVQPVRPV